MTTRLLTFLIGLTLVAATANAAPSRAKVAAALNLDHLQPGQPFVVAVTIDVNPGLHAQSHHPADPNFIPLTVTMDSNPAVEFSEPIYPAGVRETYPGLGTLDVYEGRVIVYVPGRAKTDAAAAALTLAGHARYQACDDRVCYAPEKPAFSLDTQLTAAAPLPANADLFTNYHSTEPPSAAATQLQANTAPAAENPPPASHNSAVFELLLAFTAGLIFNVMPCVLPVLPLKAMGFYEVSKHDRGKTLMLAAVFSAGIVAVFAVLAVLILVLKRVTWGEQFSNPYFVWGIVILLLLMGLWLMGVFQLMVLPTAVYRFTPSGEGYVGNFLSGILAAVLSTPCTAPLFPPLLLWAHAQPVWLGVLAMLTVGVGMASPYVLLSAFPELARKFPRTGPWAELFKQMMGWLLIGVAVYFAAGRTIPGAQFWWAVFGVSIAAAVYLVARSAKLGKGRLRPIVVGTCFAVIMVGATGAAAAWMNGLLSEEVVKWEPYSDARLAEARAGGHVVLVKFTANWCANCQYIEGTVYHDARTAKALKEYDVVALKADLTREDAPGSGLLTQLNPTGGIPLTAIYPKGGGAPEQISSVYTTDTLVDLLGKKKG